MPSAHKTNPVTFRPPESDRTWLYAYAERAGEPVGRILVRALAALRAAVEAEAQQGGDE